VNVLHADWTEIGAKYNLSTAVEEGLCDGECCRCLSPPSCTDVRGSCQAAFGGAGSCINAWTGDLSNIDITVHSITSYAVIFNLSQLSFIVIFSPFNKGW